MKIKVFIENEAGSSQKNIFDEKTLEYNKTVKVSRPYPYPYGFIIDTNGEDGDNIDCFVLTNQRLKAGEVVECIPIGLMEQVETSWDPGKKGIKEKDHNVLACLQEEKKELNDDIKSTLRKFVMHVFEHIPGKAVDVGEFRGIYAVKEYINNQKD